MSKLTKEQAKLMIDEMSLDNFLSTTATVAGADKKQGNENNISKAIELYELLVSSGIEFFCDEAKNTYVSFDGSGRHTARIDSDEFKRWIYKYSYDENQTTYSTDTIKASQQLMSAQAVIGNSYDLKVRSARNEDGIWYDLGDSAVHITKDGWSINEKPPILFHRYNHQLKQVTPQKNGSLDPLLKLLNIKSETSKNLLIIFLLTAFIPGFPHPVLVIHGEHGSAKSTLFRLLKSLIDPSSISVLPPIKNSEQFIQIVSHHQASFFDNLSKMPQDLSDNICRVVSGDGYSKRKLYTDDDDIVKKYQHIIGINGINNIVTSSDLLDRSIIVELERIQDIARKKEGDIFQYFEKHKPKILGACFDAVSKAMAIEPSINLKEYSRMADFIQWGAAIAEATKIGQKVFLTDYKANIMQQNDFAIQSSPLALAVIEFMTKQSGDTVECTPAELLKQLNDTAEDMSITYSRDEWWPKTSVWLTRSLKRVAPNLESCGIRISSYKSKKRMLKLKKLSNFEEVNSIDTEKEVTIDDIPFD